jgi:hypothetical protein
LRNFSQDVGCDGIDISEGIDLEVRVHIPSIVPDFYIFFLLNVEECGHRTLMSSLLAKENKGHNPRIRKSKSNCYGSFNLVYQYEIIG